MEQKIVMVVDKMSDHKLSADIFRNDLEGNSVNQTMRLKNSLEKIGDVVCYDNIVDFASHLHEHIDDIVFPMYYGPASYNSKGIVPSLCDTYGIKYIGADAYTQLLYNDKALSKLYASNFGICSPKGYVLRPGTNPEIAMTAIQGLQLPMVVKPNVGGGSTGISVNNIVFDYKSAVELAVNLIDNLQIPILAEEYIAGYEVELITVGSHHNISFCEEVQLLMENKSFFDHELWGYETKSIDDSSVEFSMSNYISTSDRRNLLELFHSFEKIEMLRFDGRVKNGKFYLIELSPDCYLGDDCAFYYAFQQKGYSHDEMFRFLIRNSLALD